MIPSELEAPDSKRSKDRFFVVWQTASGPSAGAFVREAIGAVTDYERDHLPRRRGRRQIDQERFEASVDGILADMIVVASNQRETRGTAITRSKQILSRPSRYQPSWMTAAMSHVLDLLEATKFIRMAKGQERLKGYRGQRTLIYPGPRLITDVTRLGVLRDEVTRRDKEELIILKSLRESSLDDAEYEDYIDNDLTNRLRREVQALNDWFASADLNLDEGSLPPGKYRLLDRKCRRIFTRGDHTFSKGGRLFGGYWQWMSKQERSASMFINGENIATLDYKQIGPRIMYAMAREGRGTQQSKPLPHDLYAIEGIDARYRDGIKKLMNAILFATKPLSRLPKGPRSCFLSVWAAVSSAH